MTAGVAGNRVAVKDNPILKAVVGNIVPPIVALLIFCAIWQLFSTETFPGPLQVIQDSFADRGGAALINPIHVGGESNYWGTVYDAVVKGTGSTNIGLFWLVLSSLKRVAIGYCFAAIVGILVGILVGTNDLMYRALDPIFQFLRTVPPLAWVPISLAALQKNEPAALFVIFVTAIWPILINTAVGVKQIPQDYNNVAKVLRLSKQKYFFKVLIPATVPYIFTGLRIGIGLSWLAIIAAEIVMSGVPGIGFFIWDEYQNNYVTGIIIALIYIGAVGLVLDRFIAFIATLMVPGEQR
jgi:bicarbonate transport system permease protein